MILFFSAFAAQNENQDDEPTLNVRKRKQDNEPQPVARKKKQGEEQISAPPENKQAREKDFAVTLAGSLFGVNYSEIIIPGPNDSETGVLGGFDLEGLGFVIEKQFMLRVDLAMAFGNPVCRRFPGWNSHVFHHRRRDF